MQGLQVVLNEPASGVLELQLVGEVDIASVDPLRDAAVTAVGSGKYGCLVFDLCGVSFMDSTGLHVLAETQRQLAAAGGSVKVVCASANLRKILEVTALDRLFTVVAERSEAFAVAA